MTQSVWRLSPLGHWSWTMLLRLQCDATCLPCNSVHDNDEVSFCYCGAGRCSINRKCFRCKELASVQDIIVVVITNDAVDVRHKEDGFQGG